MENDLFQSCGHCWVFQICWHTECCTLIASSFRIWNSSAGILSPPLALFTVMLPKVHLTSQEVQLQVMTIPLWLSGLLRLFCIQFSSVAQSCPTLCDPMNHSMPGLPAHHQLPELTQTHDHRVSDAIQPSHPVVPFSSCLQSFPASGSFQMSQLFASGGQSTGISASTSVLPMNI